jgi:CSLREA domain-containing protein
LEGTAVKPQLFLAFLCAFALLATLSLFAAPASAATTLTVTNLGDASDDNIGNGVCHTAGGVCTLRAAIQEANALAGADTINITATGTIVLGSMLPPITSAITITGPGAASLTISGNNLVGVMQVNSGAVASLSGVTIANGNATQGAGIQISGTLAISNTTFRANAAGTGGAIYNDGGMTTLFSSTLYSNSSAGVGGVINNVNSGVITVASTNFYSNTGGAGAVVSNDTTSSVNISNSAVYSNTTAGSGMISNSGEVMITNSSFYSNTASVNSGVLYNDVTGTVTISNSVFYTNTANAGGAFTNQGTLVITNSTFYDNRGILNSGVAYNSGTMTMTSSTLFGNHGPTAGGIWNNGGTLFLRNNIIAFNSPVKLLLTSINSLGYNLSANDCFLIGTGI